MPIFEAIKGVFRRLVSPILKILKRPKIVYRSSKGMYYSTIDKKHKRAYIELRVWNYHLEENKYSEEDLDEWMDKLIEVGSAFGGLRVVKNWVEFGIELSKPIEVDEILRVERGGEIELDTWYGFVVFVHRREEVKRGEVVLVPERFYWYLFIQRGEEFELLESGEVYAESLLDGDIRISEALQGLKWFRLGE